MILTAHVFLWLHHSSQSFMIIYDIWYLIKPNECDYPLTLVSGRSTCPLVWYKTGLCLFWKLTHRIGPTFWMWRPQCRWPLQSEKQWVEVFRTVGQFSIRALVCVCSWVANTPVVFLCCWLEVSNFTSAVIFLYAFLCSLCLAEFYWFATDSFSFPHFLFLLSLLSVCCFFLSSSMWHLAPYSSSSSPSPLSAWRRMRPSTPSSTRQRT